jgi:DNA mismatch repair protein MutL
MPDIIKLLPDSVANQIAAGEVIQRPASAVKELFENSIDAGGRNIKLIVKEAGKTLIQVIDDGCGMSETDARMCFERHATSKIRKAEDIFAIRTMGFRGEAMASIAAVAQVETKTKKREDELGTILIIEGSKVLTQEPVQCSDGTSTSIKNLFFNIPARRNFLKSDTVELRHIMDEFQRVALAHPELSFSMYHNDGEIFRLDQGVLRQRIVALFGNNYNDRLVPVEEETEIVKIKGFVSKPEFAKKTRGEQFFFVNKRFIKSPYLHHAVQTAYEEFLQDNTFPSYFLNIEIAPETIDINIHPTKTEIKFQDEKLIYAIMRSAIRQSLGKFHIAPTLDFNQETAFTLPYSYKDKEVKSPTIKVNPDFNPFDKPEQEHKKSQLENWEKLFEGFEKQQHTITRQEDSVQQQIMASGLDSSSEEPGLNSLIYQLQKKYIITNIKSGIVVIDQQNAHERVIFEKIIASLDKAGYPSQQLLFPQTETLPAQDATILLENIEELQRAGFDLRDFGNNSIIISGIPAGSSDADIRSILEEIIEFKKQDSDAVKNSGKEGLAKAMARRMCVKSGRNLSEEEMKNLVDELFSCSMPYSSPSGKPTLFKITLDDLDKKFLK